MKLRVSHRVCLVLAVLVLSAIAVGSRIRLSQHRQQTAIAEIEKLGGVVSLKNGGPDWLRRIVGNETMRCFDGVYLVNLSETQAADSDLENLQAMTEVERLNLANVPVTDSGLVHLQDLTDLAALDLSRTKVTDTGLIHLRKLPHLRYLYLGGTRVTDAGLRHLLGLPELRQLSVEGTDVTDAGIAVLGRELPELVISR
jgi:Leucine-rich repeat (LRR) protein